MSFSEGPQAVLSETKEGPLSLLEHSNAEVLRGVYPERKANAEVLRFPQSL
jgi:hypothetical protein